MVKDLKNLTSVILAGGMGTRLREVISDRQKVMAEVRGKPFLEYLLEQLASFNITEVILCTCYMGEQIKTIFGNSYNNIHLQYSQEITPLGTGGALKLALPFLNSDEILVMNGDSFCHTDLSDFYSFHLSRKSKISLVLTEMEHTGRYGRVKTDEKGIIKSFEEKGFSQEPGWINAGIYLINYNILLSIPENKSISLEKEIFPLWTGREMYGYKSKGKFIDIGIPSSYKDAENFFMKEDT